MISVRDVHKSYGRIYAVRGVSFDLPTGKVVGLLGPNGAGKSTTIKMITGYLPPDRGRVVVGKADTLDHSLAARQLIGYLPESAPLYTEMKPEDYLDFRGKLFGMPRQARRAAVEAALEHCWLKDVRSRRIATLSKGYRQRVGLAAALIHNPPVLILDEPTNGLDPSQIRETRRLIRELATNRTLLISTHILSEIEQMADRVIILAGGVVRADGAPSDLIEKARQVATYVMQARRVVSGDDDKMLKLLRGLPHVAEVLPDTSDRATQVRGWSLWIVRSKPGAPDLRELIGEAAFRAGVVIKELRREVVSLERVFLEVTEDQDPQSTQNAKTTPTMELTAS
jgi:ABC-2 type transport system ATP-binding protein